MLDRYVYKDGKKLRCGYTTGSCAAAAAKAASMMLVSGKVLNSVELRTPGGIMLQLKPEDIQIGSGYASCCIIKDSGDDPDITNGIKIYAMAELRESGIEITGGEGIGVVTKPGLDQPVGEYAINTVPRKMIRMAVSEIAESFECGFRIIISAPEGRAIAEKTYNPRMGITGGISIIGTTGIVEPMSNSALVETIRTEAKMLRAEGRKKLLITLGNYSDSFVQENLKLDLEKSVKCSNFIGDALDISAELGFERVLIVGHIGKLVKLGAGIMNTHSAFADGRMEVLITCGVLAGADISILKEIADCATVDAALEIFRAAGCLELVLDILINRIDEHIKAHVKGAVKAEAVVFSFKSQIMIKTSGADELIREFGEEQW